MRFMESTGGIWLSIPPLEALRAALAHLRTYMDY